MNYIIHERDMFEYKTKSYKYDKIEVTWLYSRQMFHGEQQKRAHYEKFMKACKYIE